MGARCGKHSHLGPNMEASGQSVTTVGQGGTVERQPEILKATKGTKMASARLRRGDILEWYSFESKVLGTGFSGPVRLAVNKQCGRKYAVKPFSKLGANKDKVNMLRNESQIYLRVDHPNIARLIEIWESSHHIYIVMEYCSGGELYDHLCARKVYSESAARNVALQMFSAVNYLHKHSIVHRDIKLENWLYETSEENANLKLIDFGFSIIWDPEKAKRMHATCGTLLYVSPDTLLGGYTNACDVWSLGVLVYMLLVGYPPFYGAEEEMFSRILEGQYSLSGPRWDKISPMGKEFVHRLLQKDCSKRLTALEALQHPWLSNALLPSPALLEPAVVESLRRFAERSRFQRAALTLMAFSLTSTQIEGMHNVFFNIDKSKEGTIRYDELNEALSEDVSPNEVLKIFKSLASSDKDQVYFSDFLAAMLTHKIPIDQDALRRSFLQFDTDRSGFISFRNVQETLGGDERYTEQKLRRLFAEADKDGNGLIDFEEFARMIVVDNEATIEKLMESQVTLFQPQITTTSQLATSLQSARSFQKFSDDNSSRLPIGMPQYSAAL